LFVCEAVFVYLAEEQVRTVLSELAHRFEGSVIAFDTAVRTFPTPQPEIASSRPARYRYGIPLLARLLPAVVNSYKLNLFTLGTQS
jgi:hypothetical protein